VVVQHIAAGFETALARWLAADSGLDVQIARDGEGLQAGTVRLAPPGAHLVVDVGRVSRLDLARPAINGHRPSVDALFRSLLDHDPTEVAAVLLSGMGTDGVAAMAELRHAGALTLAQSEDTCAMWGMPRAAVERNAASYSLAPAEIADVLCRASRCRGGR
jgi:chemotaxis response regulator CheB